MAEYQIEHKGQVQATVTAPSFDGAIKLFDGGHHWVISRWGNGSEYVVRNCKSRNVKVYQRGSPIPRLWHDTKPT